MLMMMLMMLLLMIIMMKRRRRRRRRRNGGVGQEEEKDDEEEKEEEEEEEEGDEGVGGEDTAEVDNIDFMISTACLPAECPEAKCAKRRSLMSTAVKCVSANVRSCLFFYLTLTVISRQCLARALTWLRF